MKDARRPHRDDPDRRRTATDGRDAEFSASGTVITLPRLPRGLRRGHATTTSDAEATTPSAAARRCTSRRRRCRAASLDARGPRDQAAGALHRGDAGQGARGARHRPPVDVRLDHRTILDRGYVYKKGTRARAVLDRVRRRHACWRSTSASSSTTSSPRDGGRLDEIAGGDGRAVAWLERSTSATDRVRSASREATRGCRRWSTTSASIDARELNSFPVGDGIVLRVGRYGPYLERGRSTSEDGDGDDRARQRARRPAARRAHPRARPRSCSPARPATSELGADPETGLRGRGEERPLRPLRHRGPARGRAEDGQAAHRVAVQVDVARHGHARRRGEAAVAAARGRHRRRGRRDHRAERPLRALPEEGHRLALAHHRGAALHDHARRGARDLRPAQAARPRRRRAAAEASSAPTRRRASRSW